MQEKASRFASSAGSEEIELAADSWEEYENCDSNDLEDTDFVPKNIFRSSKDAEKENSSAEKFRFHQKNPLTQKHQPLTTSSNENISSKSNSSQSKFAF